MIFKDIFFELFDQILGVACYHFIVPLFVYEVVFCEPHRHNVDRSALLDVVVYFSDLVMFLPGMTVLMMV